MELESKLRRICDLRAGDSVLSPSMSNDEYDICIVSKIVRIENAPVVRIMVSSQLKSEALYISGLPLLLVSGLDKEITTDPDFPEYWLSELREMIGWQEIRNIDSLLRVSSIADSFAQIWGVSQVWKSNVAAVGWVESSRDSDFGFQIEFADGEIVECDESVTICRLAEGLEGGDLYLDRHDSVESAERFAFRQDVFFVEIDGNRPFFVGKSGLQVQPGTLANSFFVWCHERIWED